MNYGRPFRGGGKELDSATYKKLRDVHLKSTFPPVLRGILMNELFQSAPEFRWLGKVVQPSNWFSDVVRRYWMPFLRDVLDEIFTLGIVAVRLQKLPGGSEHVVPVVISETLGDDYTIVVSKKHNMKKFTYYRLKKPNSDGPSAIEEPKKDPKVYIFSGFGYDPDYTGHLNSILAGSLGQDSYVHSMYRFSIRAEFNLSNPTVMTETTPESEGIIKESDRYDSYVTGDRIVRDSQSRIFKDDKELVQVLAHQKNYFDMLTETPGYRTENPLEPGTYDVFKKQHRDNMFPLPTNHKLVQQQLPSPIRGSDWETVNRVYQDTMSGVYVVPRGKVFSDTATRSSAATTESVEKSYMTNIKKWKAVLGEILTAVYRCVYAEDDCYRAMKFYTDREIEDMSEDQFVETVTKPRIEVSLPLVPRENMDDLLLQYVMKVIDWPTFKELSIRISGYSVVGEQSPSSTEKDPWDDEHKLSIINSVGKGALSKAGIVAEDKFPKRKEPDDPTRKGAVRRPGSKSKGSANEERKRTKTKKAAK